MRRTAAKIDANQVQVVKALRAIGTKVLSLAPLGHGCPDLLCYRPGIGLVLLEVKDGSKSPSRRALTPDQVDFHTQWPVKTVNDIAEALAALTQRGT